MTRQSATAPRRVAPTNKHDLGIVDSLAQLTFLIHSTLADHAAAHDLSVIQLRLLGILRDCHPAMNDLAQLLELDKSSITGLVDRAELRGLVKRTVSAADRRVYRVSLTRSGRTLVDRVAKDFAKDISTIVGNLSGREQTVLSGLASRVVMTANPAATG